MPSPYITMRAAGLGAGAASLGTLFVTITADSIKLHKGLADATMSLEKSTALMQKIAVNAAVAMGAAFGAMAGIAVKEYAKFEHEMTRAAAIFGDVNEQMRAELEDTARTLATQTNVSAVDLAKNYQVLASAGLSASEAQEALGVVTKFSIAGFVDAGQAVDYLAGAQAALHLQSDDTAQSIENMTRISDVLVKANAIAKGTVEDFAAALANKAAVGASLAGKELEEVVAILAAMADRNIRGRHAGEQLYIALRDLQRVAVENSSAFDQWNIEVFNSQGNMNHMADILEDLETAFASLTTAQRRIAIEELGFQDRSIASILALVGLSKEVRNYEVQLKGASGTTEDMSNKILGSFINQLTITWNTFKDMLLTIGQHLIPTLRVLNQLFLDLGDPNTGIGALMKPVAEFFGDALLFHVQNSIAIFKTFADVALATAETILKSFKTTSESVDGLIIATHNRGVQLYNLLIDLNRAATGLPQMLLNKLGVMDRTFFLQKMEPADMKETPRIDAALETIEKLRSKLRGIDVDFTKTSSGYNEMVRRIISSNKALDGSIEENQIQEASRRATEVMERMQVPEGVDMLSGTKRELTDAEALAMGGFRHGKGELYRLQAEQEALRNNLATLRTLGEDEVGLTEEVQARKLRAIEIYQNKLKNLKEEEREVLQAQQQFVMASFTSIGEDMLTIGAVFFGKQTAMYKAMFAASKAFAIAESTVKIMQGIANAAAYPWPANLGAMASVIAATANIVSTIQSVSLEFGGARAAGGQVRAGVSYVVGERGPERFTPSSNGNITASNKLGGNVKVIVENYGNEGVAVREQMLNEERVINITIGRVKAEMASEIAEGRGSVSKALDQSFALRRGRH